MAESGLPYDRDFDYETNDEPRYERRSELRLTRRQDAILAAMQRKIRQTPGCRGIAVVTLGSGWGTGNFELIEMEGPTYWGWKLEDFGGEKPKGGLTLSPVDLRTGLAALRSEHPHLRCLFEPMEQWRGRLTSLSIATQDDGDWIIWGRSHNLDEPNVRESWAAMVWQVAEYAARRAAT